MRFTFYMGFTCDAIRGACWSKIHKVNQIYKSAAWEKKKSIRSPVKRDHTEI